VFLSYLTENKIKFTLPITLMNLDYIFSVTYSFLITHQLVSLGILIILALFLWRKPWGFFKLTLVVLGLMMLIYVVNLFDESVLSGFGNKKQMIHKSESELSK